jgi:hypothetical protein
MFRGRGGWLINAMWHDGIGLSLSPSGWPWPLAEEKTPQNPRFMRSLSSGAHSRDPLAPSNDDGETRASPVTSPSSPWSTAG